MPLVTVSTVRGALDNAQKTDLLRRIADLMVEIEGQGKEDFRKLVWVKIEEQEPAHWSLGGVALTHDRIVHMFGTIAPDGTRINAASA